MGQGGLGGQLEQTNPPISPVTAQLPSLEHVERGGPGPWALGAAQDTGSWETMAGVADRWAQLSEGARPHGPTGPTVCG